MTNVTSAGAQAGVVEVAYSETSENPPPTGVEPKNPDLLPAVPDGDGTAAAGGGFGALGLSADVLKAVELSGYTTPTPIQAQGIPHVLQRRDIIGIAQTGTGKTASFTLPMIEMLARGRAKARMPRSLILEPTRELAAQVAESFESYGKFNKLSMALLIGGTSFDDQDQQARPRRRRADRDPGPPARSFRARQADALARSRFSSSTKPTACSTWASSRTSSASAS